MSRRDMSVNAASSCTDIDISNTLTALYGDHNDHIQQLREPQAAIIDNEGW